MIFDSCLIWLAFCAAYYMRYALRVTPDEAATVPVAFRDWIPFGMAFSLLELASLIGTGYYRARLGRDLLDEGLLILRASLVGVGLVAIVTTFLPILAPSRLVIVYAWLASLVFLLLGRALLYGALGRLHGNGWNTRRVLVAGTTSLSRMVLQNLLSKRNQGYQLIGFVQESVPCGPAMPGRGDFGRFKCLGRVADLGRRDLILADRRGDRGLARHPSFGDRRGLRALRASRSQRQIGAGPLRDEPVARLYGQHCGHPADHRASHAEPAGLALAVKRADGHRRCQRDADSGVADFAAHGDRDQAGFAGSDTQSAEPRR